LHRGIPFQTATVTLANQDASKASHSQLARIDIATFAAMLSAVANRYTSEVQALALYNLSH